MKKESPNLFIFLGQMKNRPDASVLGRETFIRNYGEGNSSSTGLVTFQLKADGLSESYSTSRTTRSNFVPTGKIILALHIEAKHPSSTGWRIHSVPFIQIFKQLLSPASVPAALRIPLRTKAEVHDLG